LEQTVDVLTGEKKLLERKISALQDEIEESKQRSSSGLNEAEKRLEKE
jgi:hypothetical protein